MGKFEDTGPSKPITESTRVDKVTPRYRLTHSLRALIVIIVAVIMLIPVLVMVVTAFKSRADILSVPPKITFQPTLEGFVFLLTDRSIASPTNLEAMKKAAEAGQLSLFERIALQGGMTITGTSDYVSRLKNSLIIAGVSTILSVVLALFAAYAFSRFEVKGRMTCYFSYSAHACYRQ